MTEGAPIAPGHRVLAPALAATLTAPVTWLPALAAFLLRGGLALVALPILILPTPVGVGNALGPALTSIAFGSFPSELVAVVLAVVLAAVAWLLLGGWLAAALEVEGMRRVAGDRAFVPAPLQHPAVRILAARLLAAAPLGAVLGLGSVRLVFVTYRELTTPLDVATPIFVRVLQASPEVVAAVLVAWVLAEVVGALAARRIALAGRGVAGALRDAVVTSLRHPLATAIRFALPLFVLIVVLGSATIAAATAFGAAAAGLDRSDDPVATVLAVAGLVALWILGLVLIGIVGAWRSSVWTLAEMGAERDVRGVR